MPTGWKYDAATKKIMQVDPTFRDHSHYIKLKKNVYGTKQASANFYEHLCKGLLNQDFTPSITDPCLWIRHDCIICQCVDDCLIFANTDQIIDYFIH